MNNFYTTLFKIINNTVVTDTNYQIAYFILNSFNDIENLSFKDIPDKVFVSQSTFKRFMKFFNYTNFSTFKTMIINHRNIRLAQIDYRFENISDNKIKQMMELCLSKEELDTIFNQDLIDQCCKRIKESDYVVLLGSDEMRSHCLRFQCDFEMMNKLVIQKEIEDIYESEDNYYCLLMSMSGTFIDMSAKIIHYVNNNSNYAHFGYHQDRITGLRFIIPNHIGEVLEGVILDYYLEKIVYTYRNEYL